MMGKHQFGRAMMQGSALASSLKNAVPSLFYGIWPVNFFPGLFCKICRVYAKAVLYLSQKLKINIYSNLSPI